MAQEKKDNQNEEKKRSFVREHIVPRKKTKKIILTILSTIGLALLFGAIAGVAFFVSQDILDGNNGTEVPPTVSISRDESRPDNTSPFFPESSSEPAQSGGQEDPASSGESDSGELFPGGETDTIPGESTPEGPTEPTSEASGEDPAGKETTEPGETPEESETTKAPETESQIGRAHV